MGDNGETFREGHQDRANFSSTADASHALPWRAKWQQESLGRSSDTQGLGWNSGSADWNGASDITHTHTETQTCRHTHTTLPPKCALTISLSLSLSHKYFILPGWLISGQLKKTKETTSIRKGFVCRADLYALLSSIFYPISCSSFLNSECFLFSLEKELEKDAVIYY